MCVCFIQNMRAKKPIKKAFIKAPLKHLLKKIISLFLVHSLITYRGTFVCQGTWHDYLDSLVFFVVTKHESIFL